MNDLFWPIFLSLLSGVVTGLTIGYCLGAAEPKRVETRTLAEPQADEPLWISDIVEYVEAAFDDA